MTRPRRFAALLLAATLFATALFPTAAANHSPSECRVTGFDRTNPECGVGMCVNHAQAPATSEFCREWKCDDAAERMRQLNAQRAALEETIQRTRPEYGQALYEKDRLLESIGGVGGPLYKSSNDLLKFAAKGAGKVVKVVSEVADFFGDWGGWTQSKAAEKMQDELIQEIGTEATRKGLKEFLGGFNLANDVKGAVENWDGLTAALADLLAARVEAKRLDDLLADLQAKLAAVLAEMAAMREACPPSERDSTPPEEANTPRGPTPEEMPPEEEDIPQDEMPPGEGAEEGSSPTGEASVGTGPGTGTGPYVSTEVPTETTSNGGGSGGGAEHDPIATAASPPAAVAVSAGLTRTFVVALEDADGDLGRVEWTLDGEGVALDVTPYGSLDHSTFSTTFLSGTHELQARVFDLRNTSGAQSFATWRITAAASDDPAGALISLASASDEDILGAILFLDAHRGEFQASGVGFAEGVLVPLTPFLDVAAAEAETVPALQARLAEAEENGAYGARFDAVLAKAKRALGRLDAGESYLTDTAPAPGRGPLLVKMSGAGDVRSAVDRMLEDLRKKHGASVRLEGAPSGASWLATSAGSLPERALVRGPAADALALPPGTYDLHLELPDRAPVLLARGVALGPNATHTVRVEGGVRLDPALVAGADLRWWGLVPSTGDPILAPLRSDDIAGTVAAPGGTYDVVGFDTGARIPRVLLRGLLVGDGVAVAGAAEPSDAQRADTGGAAATSAAGVLATLVAVALLSLLRRRHAR